MSKHKTTQKNIKVCKKHIKQNELVADKAIPIEDITIQKEELSEVLYMDYEHLKQLVKQNGDEIAFKWEVYEPIFNKLDEIINKE